MDLVPRNTVMTMDKAGDFTVSEVYLDGKLQKAEYIDDDEKSYGIFMHSLILSNYTEVMRIDNGKVNVVGSEYEKAVFYYALSKGFNKNLIESIAPKVTELTFGGKQGLKASTHLINEKIRIVSKGTPKELLSRCSYILLDSKIVKITRKIFRGVNDVLCDMVNRCLNVYAIAIKDVSRVSVVLDADTYVNEMTLVALVGIGKA